MERTSHAADDYNERRFPAESDIEAFRRFPEIVKVGTTAPQTVLTDAETGEQVELREITRRGLTILEFGSLT